MKRLFGALGLALLAVSLAAPAVAQENAAAQVTKAELARSLVLIADPDQAAGLTADAAFRRAQSAALVPREWSPEDALTQRDLVTVANRLGVEFSASALDGTVSRSELDRFSLRELGSKREMIAGALGAGRLPVDGLFDEPPDRFVSASEF